MSSSSKAPPRKGHGRRKITLEKMQDEKALQVTFSKRRAGAFKKANELCILTGANVTLITFSPASKPFSFGCPDVRANMNRLLVDGNSPAPTNDSLQQMIQAQHFSDCHSLNQELMALEAILAKEKDKARELQLQKAEGQKLKWYPRSTEELSLEEVIDLLEFLENFQKKYVEEKKKAEMTGDGSSALLVNHGDVPGSSSNPPPIGFNEFPTGFQDPGMYGVNDTHNFSFQAPPYDPTGFVSNNTNNDSLGLVPNFMNNDQIGLLTNDMNFGNHASDDPTGEQIPQDPLTTQYDVLNDMNSGLVDMAFNYTYYDSVGLIPDYINYDPVGFQVPHAPLMPQFNPIDQVPPDSSRDPHGKSTGEPSGSGMYPGESSGSYTFGFPPTDFSTGGGSGTYPGGFNGGSGSGKL